MRKKLGFAVGATALTLVLSSCFVLQGFIVLDYTLKPGQTTKARFTLRPSNFEAGAPWAGPQYEFVLVGVSSSGDLSALKGKWGTNGKFGGPMLMAVNGSLVATMGAACGSNGIDLTEITSITWKAYVTPVKIGDQNAYEKSSVTEVVVKAQGDATAGDNWTVIGVAGQWVDDGDDTPDNDGDLYQCHGMGSAIVHIIAA